MNRVLYQLSYAAIVQGDFGTAEISFVIISKDSRFVNSFFLIFSDFFGNTFSRVIFTEKWKKTAFFCIGGGTYVGLELLYRRRSHVSMFAAGGICFLLLGKLEKLRLPVWGKAIAGAGTITLVELLTGLAVNRRYRVWDYRQQPGNYRGQICPVFMLLWIPLACVGMGLYRTLERLWQRV